MKHSESLLCYRIRVSELDQPKLNLHSPDAGGTPSDERNCQIQFLHDAPNQSRRVLLVRLRLIWGHSADIALLVTTTVRSPDSGLQHPCGTQGSAVQL